jgi:hypothetical protein
MYVLYVCITSRACACMHGCTNTYANNPLHVIHIFSLDAELFRAAPPNPRQSVILSCGILRKHGTKGIHNNNAERYVYVRTSCVYVCMSCFMCMHVCMYVYVCQGRVCQGRKDATRPLDL